MSEDNMAELSFREVSCQKAVDGPSFNQGVQDYIFSCSGLSSWIPAKSYFKIDMTITGVANEQPTISQQICFADNACHALYDNVYVKAQGQDVSTLTNYVAQCGSLKTRLKKSGAWLNNVGKSAYLCEADFNKRVNAVARDTLNLVDGQPQRLYIGAVGFETTATVAIAAADGALTGVNTDLTILARGDTIVVDGVPYTCQVNGNALGVGSAVTPRPAGNVVATANAYIIKQVNLRVDGGQRNKIFALWQPPCGLFDYDKPLGSGEYRISLNPNTNYKYACLETKQGTEEKSAPQTTWDLVVNSVKLYVATVKTSIPAGISNLYLMECQVQNKPMAGLEQTFDFSIPPSTRAITIFFQSNKAGSNPRFPPSMFKLPRGGGTFSQDLLVESLQLTYANQTRPSTRWVSAFGPVAGGAGNPSINQLQQRYLDSITEAGLAESEGGAESFEDFIKRGPYYHYNFFRDASDASTQLQVSAKINFTDLATVGCNIFVAAWYSKAIELTMNGSMIEQVRSLVI